MIPTFVAAAALAVGAYEPVSPSRAPAPEVHKVPGPAFHIPCKVEAADLVAAVQLWVSTDRGKKWELHEEITPDKPAFTFIARRAGEYWFAPRIQKKDGTMLPADTADLVATQRVAVASGSDGSDPLVPPRAAGPTAAEIADELDEELTRVELEQIRKEIKKLSEMPELTREAADKFDHLRMRLRDLRHPLRRDREDRGPQASWPAQPGAIGGPSVPAVPAPPYAQPEPGSILRPAPPRVVPETPRVRPSDDGRIPPSTVPTDPLVTPVVPMPVPARPVAPPPRSPER